MKKYVFTGDGFEHVQTTVERLPLVAENRGRRLPWEFNLVHHPHQDHEYTPRQGETAEECAELGTMLFRLGKYEEGVAQLRRGAALEPENPLARSFLVLANDYVKATPAQRIAALKAWARDYTAGIRPRHIHTNDQDPERRLRVGYLSGDFFRHSAFNSWFPVLRDHDPERFEIYGYYTGATKDDYTVSARAACTEWRGVAQFSDEELFELILDDQVDVLVDLSGHTCGHRMKVFARKPAPVQLTAFGFVEGNGLEALDYVWGDDILLAPEERAAIGRPAWPLPSAFFYEAPADCPTVSQLPAAWGNPFTFGCFNKVDKITDEVLELWARVLEAVPGSRLLLKDPWYDEISIRRRLAERLAAAGVASSRVLLYGASPHWIHLQAFDDVDIALDPFPHNGGTSTCEALWMGVPVVTTYGLAPPGRAGAAILFRAGLKGFIARTLNEYVAVAAAAASEIPALESLRSTMRARLAASTVFNAELVVREIERAYRGMWRSWCKQAARGPVLQRGTR